jgi:hypothetical protein
VPCPIWFGFPWYRHMCLDISPSTPWNGSLRTHPGLVQRLMCIYCIPGMSCVPASQHSGSVHSADAGQVPRPVPHRLFN